MNGGQWALRSGSSVVPTYLFGRTHLDGADRWFSGVLVGYDWVFGQLSGSRLGSSDRGVAAIRIATSLNQVHGLAPHRLALSISVQAAAAQCPPASSPGEQPLRLHSAALPRLLAPRETRTTGWVAK